MQELVRHYQSVISYQEWTGLVAKLPLVLVLMLVASGNQKPGWQLLSATMAAHFLLAVFINLSASWPTFPLWMMCLALAGVLAYSTAKSAGEWVVLPQEQPQGLVAAASLLLAIFLPFLHPQLRIGSFLFSPVAILPHPTLLVLLILVVTSAGRLPSYVAWTAVGCGALLGFMDLLAGLRIAGLLLLAASIAATASQITPRAVTALLVKDGDEPEVALSPRASTAASQRNATQTKQYTPPPPTPPQKEQKTGKKKWDLK